MGLAYLALGLIQVGTWRVTDRFAVRVVAGASLVFVTGFVALVATAGSASSDMFHQTGVLAAIANAVVAVLYAFLLYREQTSAE